MASTPYSNIQLPKEVTDPLYTSSQASLDKVGTGLLNGDVPDYYKPIGDFDSPQFQAMLNSVKGNIMQGSQEASAINGTGRSGVAVTASNNALNSVLPNLSYQDYLRAIQGRGALLDAGLTTEQGVRSSAQNQQQFDTNFNQTLFDDQVSLASKMDEWKKSAAGSQGQMFGTIGGAALGGLLAIATGGTSIPLTLGAMSAGAGLGSSAFGGGGGGNASSISSLLPYLSKSVPTASYGNADASIGAFKSLKSSFNSSNPDIDAILNGGR